jgi:hypothetical protein
VAVPGVEVDRVGARRERVVDLAAERGEVRGEERGRDEESLGRRRGELCRATRRWFFA